MEVDRHHGMRALFLYEDAVFAITDEAFTLPIDMEEFVLTEADAGNGAKSLVYVVTIGTIATVGGTIEMRCQDSPDGSVWSDVADELVLGGEDLTVESGNGLVIPIGAENIAYRLGCISKEPHQRLAMTEETAVTAGQVGVVAILQDFRHNPQEDQSS